MKIKRHNTTEPSRRDILRALSLLNARLRRPSGHPEAHSFAIGIADEINRMDNNMERMDPATRGLRQLRASLQRIRGIFAEHGYEIVEMRGTVYREGMNASADFLDNPDLEPGTRVIARVERPQLNCDGRMVRPATITVQQNIG